MKVGISLVAGLPRPARILGRAGLRSKRPELPRTPLPRTGGWSRRVAVGLSCSCGTAPGATLPGPSRSAAQAEPLDERPVARHVDRSQVLQQPAPTPDQQQQAAAGVVVVLVLLEVLGEVRDS